MGHLEPLEGKCGSLWKPRASLELGWEESSGRGWLDLFSLTRPSQASAQGKALDLVGCSFSSLPGIHWSHPLASIAFVFQGCHKMADTALRHFVAETSGSLGEEETPASCLPRVAWTEPRTSAPPTPTWLWPWLPQVWHNQLLGKGAWESWPLSQLHFCLTTHQANREGGCTSESGKASHQHCPWQGLGRHGWF